MQRDQIQWFKKNLLRFVHTWGAIIVQFANTLGVNKSNNPEYIVLFLMSFHVLNWSHYNKKVNIRWFKGIYKAVNWNCNDKLLHHEGNNSDVIWWDKYYDEVKDSVNQDILGGCGRPYGHLEEHDEENMLSKYFSFFTEQRSHYWWKKSQSQKWSHHFKCGTFASCVWYK